MHIVQHFDSLVHVRCIVMRHCNDCWNLVWVYDLLQMVCNINASMSFWHVYWIQAIAVQLPILIYKVRGHGHIRFHGGISALICGKQNSCYVCFLDNSLQFLHIIYVHLQHFVPQSFSRWYCVAWFYISNHLSKAVAIYNRNLTPVERNKLSYFLFILLCLCFGPENESIVVWHTLMSDASAEASHFCSYSDRCLCSKCLVRLDVVSANVIVSRHKSHVAVVASLPSLSFVKNFHTTLICRLRRIFLLNLVVNQITNYYCHFTHVSLSRITNVVTRVKFSMSRILNK